MASIGFPKFFGTLIGGYSRSSTPFVRDKNFGIIKNQQEADLWSKHSQNNYASTRIILFEKEVKEKFWSPYSIFNRKII